MTSLIDSSKKPPSDVGVSQSFRLDYKEKKRVDALCEKHSLDRHVFYRNCVMDHVREQEEEDMQVKASDKVPKE